MRSTPPIQPRSRKLNVHPPRCTNNRSSRR
jgi:hypothetical protein